MKTEVLIVGGGIAGILTALFLHEKNIPYILVEKNKLYNGVTKRTTAKITFQHNLIYGKIKKHYNTETAQKYLNANMIAFNKFKELASKIDCDYEIKNNYVYSLNNRYALEDEAKVLDDIGFHAELTDNIKIPLDVAGALCFKNQAQFNVIKFLEQIINKLNYIENCFIKRIDKNIAYADNFIYSSKQYNNYNSLPFY